jgi:hypothetical protein
MLKLRQPIAATTNLAFIVESSIEREWEILVAQAPDGPTLIESGRFYPSAKRPGQLCRASQFRL